MNDHVFDFHGARLHARPSGALWWPGAGLLCVSDLHLGKADRLARRGGAMLPPYEGRDTLLRLDAEIAATGATTVICIGDSFDDAEAAATLAPDLADWLARLAAGLRWIWVEGNHDPGPLALPGSHRARVTEGAIGFCHIATGATAEVSGHYHPKARIGFSGGSLARPCFLIDRDRIVLPAFGTYTGGLFTTDPALSRLMGDGALAVLTGTRAHALPMPRTPRSRKESA